MANVLANVCGTIFRMTTQPLTLTGFLLARIAEDEASVVGVNRGRWNSRVALLDPDLYGLVSRQHPDRVLAECDAKRRIIEFHESWPVLVELEPDFTNDPTDLTSMTFRMTKQIAWATEREYRNRFGVEPPTAPMLRALAAVYAAHPDYDQEWRP